MRRGRRRFLEVITIPETNDLRALLYIRAINGTPRRWTVIQIRERRWWGWRFVSAGSESDVIDYADNRRTAKEWLRSLHNKRKEHECPNAVRQP